MSISIPSIAVEANQPKVDLVVYIWVIPKMHNSLLMGRLFLPVQTQSRHISSYCQLLLFYLRNLGLVLVPGIVSLSSIRDFSTPRLLSKRQGRILDQWASRFLKYSALLLEITDDEASSGQFDPNLPTGLGNS